MKNKTSITILAVLISMAISAQIPQAANYQAIARNSTGAVLQNQHISIRFSVHDGSPIATITYQETDTATTNQFGLFTAFIGNGTATVGTFTGIAWATGNKYLEVELDPAGGSNYNNMGTTQMASVPYALYASSSGTSGQVTAYNILFNGIPITDSSLNFAAISTYQFITKTNYLFAISAPAISTAGIIDSIPMYDASFTDDTSTEANVYVIANPDYPAGRILRLGYGASIPLHNGQVYYVPLNATATNPANLFQYYSGFWHLYPANGTQFFQAFPNNSSVTGFNLPNVFTVKFQRY